MSTATLELIYYMFQAGRYNAVCCRYITCSLKPPCCRNAHTLCLREEGGQVVFTSSFGTHLGFRSSTLLPKDKGINAPPRKTLSQPCPSPKNSSKLQGSREARVTCDPKNKYLHFLSKTSFAYLLFVHFWYTTALFQPAKVHQQVRKFATE